MITGVGIDQAEVERIRKVFVNRGERFRDRVFTKLEWEYAHRFQDPFVHLTARFCAKEAYYKAVGKGVLAFHEIEVQNEPTGKPFIILHGQTREAWLTAGEPFVHLSLTHTAISAAAVVVIEGR